jgi:hypothetical protein
MAGWAKCLVADLWDTEKNFADIVLKKFCI